MILAFFTASAASAMIVPETAYGPIATSERSITVEQVAMASVSTVGTVETNVRSYFRDIPVMIEIARCESNFLHNLQDGTVLRGRVDGADTGVMQINRRYHEETANSMNLNLDDLYHNMVYARHLYEIEGTRPWNASANCWSNTLAMN